MVPGIRPAGKHSYQLKLSTYASLEFKFLGGRRSRNSYRPNCDEEKHADSWKQKCTRARPQQGWISLLQASKKRTDGSILLTRVTVKVKENPCIACSARLMQEWIWTQEYTATNPRPHTRWQKTKLQDKSLHRNSRSCPCVATCDVWNIHAHSLYNIHGLISKHILLGKKCLDEDLEFCFFPRVVSKLSSASPTPMLNVCHCFNVVLLSDWLGYFTLLWKVFIIALLLYYHYYYC